MNNLYIDYEKGIDFGAEIKDKSIKLYELLQNMKDIQDKLSINDNNDDLKQLNNDLNVIIALSEIVGQTGDFLINVSNAYKNVDMICNQKEEKN